MSFYHPELLYGLFAIAIPIIIHLFNFKRFKKVYFTNVRFLRNVQQQSKRHSQWRHLLVLAARILVVTFIVLAFARPFIPLQKQNEKALNATRYVTIFLDNSFSMEAEAAEGNLLEEGRKKAREIALAYNPSDNFRLLLNNQIPESNRFLNRDEFLNALDEVHIEAASLPFSKIIKRVSNFDFDNQVSEQELYLISDFQKSQADIKNWAVDSSLQINLVHLVFAAQNNIFIDSCWFETPVLQKNTILKLRYRIKNISNQDVEKVPVSLIVNEHQKALGTINLKAFEERNEKLVFRMDSAGVFDARIEIRDFPITYDDQLFFGFKISDKIHVLSIEGSNATDAISRFYKGDSLFDFVAQPENRVDYSSFSNYDIIILNALNSYSSGLVTELKKYQLQAGTLIVIPANKQRQQDFEALVKAFSLDAFLRIDSSLARIRWMDVESKEFDDVFELDNKKFSLPDNVDMPYCRAHWLLQNSNQSPSIDLIKFDDGSSFLRKYQYQQSKIYLFTAAFDESNSNITAHALFVPVMYNLAMQGEQQSQLYYNLGQDNKIAVSVPQQGDDMVFKISSVNTDFEFIPGNIYGAGHYLLVDENSITTAGNYHLKTDDKLLQSIAFNYPRAESDLRPLTVDEIEKEIKQNHLKNINILTSGNASITAMVKDLHKGVQLWKLFLSLAILLLIIELFLLRFMK